METTMKRWRIGFVFLVIFFNACSRPEPQKPRTLTIAAASDLKFALDEAIRQFKSQHADLDVQPIYGSSGNFFTQITNNAPFDVFMSADMEYPRNLEKNGLVIDGSEFTYAVGRLAVWTRNDSPLDVPRLGMQSLLDPLIKKISIANPEHAPYGRAAVAAMQKFGVYDRVKGKIVMGENVSQALEFIYSGTAQAGIVAMSLATAPNVNSRGKYFEIPLDAYPRMDQGGVILKNVRDRQAAEQFRAFILSPECRALFKNSGFYLPEESR
jgi:molybdate transport system substrate-binding protein